jgi:hypothetical protein
METDDLLEVFGGRDNLRLMCDAKRFRVTSGGCRVSFWVGDDIVRLQRGRYFEIRVQNRKTKETRSQHTTPYAEKVRSKFEHFTGYSLGF